MAHHYISSYSIINGEFFRFFYKNLHMAIIFVYYNFTMFIISDIFNVF